MILIFLQKAYVFAFLLSARLFIPPSELLARVCELCIKQQQLDQSPLDMVSTAPHVNVPAEARGPPWSPLLPVRFMFSVYQIQISGGHCGSSC